MDKKMHEVTRKMKTAGHKLKAGKSKDAAALLKGAEKQNEKLVKQDRDVRDPKIKACDKMMKKTK